MEGIAPVVTYYPKYVYLDNVIEKSERKDLNLYLDLKNCAQGLYMEITANRMINDTQRARYIDLSLFFSFLEFVSWHKTYAKKRKLNLNMYFFWESGDSSYHTAILKEYKANRNLADFFGFDEARADLFYKIIDKNLELIFKVGNQLPGVQAIRFEYLEADFVPYYLIERVLPDADKKTHIIYSSDKDMNQCLTHSNRYQFCRSYHKVKMLSSNTVVEDYLGKDILDPSYMPLFHSIIGDSGDNIQGVYGVAQKKIIGIANEIPQMFGTMKEVFDKIQQKQSLFKSNFRTNNKVCMTLQKNEERIVRNLKLVSYYLLSEFFDSNFPLIILEKKKALLKEILEGRPKIKNGEVLIRAFENLGVSSMITENTMYNIFQ